MKHVQMYSQNMYQLQFEFTGKWHIRTKQRSQTFVRRSIGNVKQEDVRLSTEKFNEIIESNIQGEWHKFNTKQHILVFMFKLNRLSWQPAPFVPVFRFSRLIDSHKTKIKVIFQSNRQREIPFSLGGCRCRRRRLCKWTVSRWQRWSVQQRRR